MDKDWTVYIARCGDGSLYTGIAKDVDARMKLHNEGKGAAYTRSRLPVELAYSEPGMTRSEALVREAAIKRLRRPFKERLLSKLAAAAVLLLGLAGVSQAASTFNKENAIRVTSGTIQAATGTYPAKRLFYIRGSSLVYSAQTTDGLTLTEEAGVRLSSLTVPAVDIALSSITGLSILPLDAGGWRMLYSVIGTTSAYRIYGATSADGLAWANDTGTAVNLPSSGGYPAMVELTSTDWRLYYIQGTAIFSALSTNEGRNWGAGSSVVAGPAGQVAAARLTGGKVRLYYSAPLTAGTSNVTILSALSTDTNGNSFTLESGVRLSTSPGALAQPFVVMSTDSFRWRLYYDYYAVGATTANSHSATADAPDPLAISPSTVLKNQAASASTITGDIFSTGLTALLRQGGQTDIAGAAVTRNNDQTFTAVFNTQNQAPGYWDLVVTNSNGQETTLRNAVFVDFPGGSVDLVDNLLRPGSGTTTRVDTTIFNPGRVTAKLYSLDGRFIATLYDAETAAGTVSFNWNGRTTSGAVVASGVYLLHVKGPKLDKIGKIVVVK